MWVVSRWCRCVCALTAICAVASVQRLYVAVFMHPCITALCGCLYASLHNGFVWLTASILAWTWGGSPVNSAQQSQTGLRGDAPRRSRAAALTSPPSWGRGQGGWDIKSTHCNKLKPSFFRTYFCPYPAPLSRKPHTLDYTSKKIFNKIPLTY